MSQFLWREGIITRAEVRQHPNLTYLFGDNTLHFGSGGMAYEMRGMPNTVGVPTKWAPHMSSSSFFSDEIKVDEAKKIMEDTILAAEARGYPIVVPVGIGAGLAQMPTRCPRLYEWLMGRLGKGIDPLKEIEADGTMEEAPNDN